MRLKGILGMLLAGAVAVGTAVSVFAEEIYVSSADSVNFTITSDTAKKAKVIVADYDRDGYLMSATTNTLDISEGDNVYTYQQLGVGANWLLAEGVYSNRKVLLWEEDSIKPLEAGRSADVIKVDPSEYAVACVGYIDYYNNEPMTIQLFYPAYSNRLFGSSLNIRADGTYNVTYNGKKTDISSIRTGDVISIEIEDKDKGLDDWDTYNITISRDKVLGKISSFDDKLCIMEDGSEYWCICDMPPIEKDWLYRLDFDIFGRVVSCIEVINQNSPMAVFVASTENELTAYADGELKSFEAKKKFNMTPGDTFFYRKDENGVVTEIDRILNESLPDTYTDLYNMVLDNGLSLRNGHTAYMFMNGRTDVFEDDDIVFGAIVDADYGSVTIADQYNVEDIEAVNIDACTEYDVADDVCVYRYDYDISSLHTKNRIDLSSMALFNYTIPNSAFIDDNQEILNLRSEVLLSENNADYGKIRFAVLKVVDGEVVEALVITPSNIKG